VTAIIFGFPNVLLVTVLLQGFISVGNQPGEISVGKFEVMARGTTVVQVAGLA
jgi:hypothetical protein